MDDYPGIEIRCITPEGLKFFEGNSQRLHFDLAAAGFRPGMSGDNWYPVIEGTFTLEIRAVDLPELAAAPDYPVDLYLGLPEERREELAERDELAVLAALERAAAGRAAERAAAAGLELADVDQAADVEYCNATPGNGRWPVCALQDGHQPPVHESADFYWDDGDQEATHKSYRADMAADVDQAAASPCGGCPSLTGCQLLGGCQLGPLLSEAVVVAGYAAAPVSPFPGGDAGAARPGAGPDGLTELTGEPTRGEPRQARRRLGTGIARIARRARFRSGR